MKRYLLDTGSVSDYINRVRGVFSKAGSVAATGAPVGIGMPVLGELWAGVELSRSRERNRARLLHNLASLRLWPFDKVAAEEFGRIFALLRRKGRPMQQIDVQIAAIALTLGTCTVVTKDKDFSAVPGLSVENWSSP